MNRATALATLTAELAKIVPANGYATHIRSVRTGRASLAVAQKDPLPLLTVHGRSETPAAEQRSRLATQTWTRAVVIQGHLPASETWDADLDALADDLRRCVYKARLGPGAEWESFEYFPPDPDSNLCVLQATLNLTHILTLTP